MSFASQHVLALVLRDQRKWTEAEDYFRQTLEARRRALGPEHLDTLRVQHNLALLLQNQGKHPRESAVVINDKDSRRLSLRFAPP